MTSKLLVLPKAALSTIADVPAHVVESWAFAFRFMGFELYVSLRRR